MHGGRSRGEQYDQVMTSAQVNDEANNTDQMMNIQQVISLEITTCFSLAYSPELKLGTGCPHLNEFLR